jgi:hypothetical protein
MGNTKTSPTTKKQNIFITLFITDILNLPPQTGKGGECETDNQETIVRFVPLKKTLSIP